MPGITLDELKRYRSVRDNVSSIDEQIARLRAESERVTTDLERIGGRSGIQTDKISSFISQLESLINRRTEAYIYAVDLLDRIDAAVTMLPAAQSNVIRARYMDGRRFIGWDALALKMHYSRSGVLALHHAAMLRLGLK